MINLKVRFKNPVFVVQVVLAVLTPILAYAGLLLEAISNPYVLSLVVVSVWNAINDPTTSGLNDSTKALEYTEPKKD